MLHFWHPGPGAYGGWDEKAVSMHKEQTETDTLGIAEREKGERDGRGEKFYMSHRVVQKVFLC